jgi:hypothetical protein
MDYGVCHETLVEVPESFSIQEARDNQISEGLPMASVLAGPIPTFRGKLIRWG